MERQKDAVRETTGLKTIPKKYCGNGASSKRMSKESKPVKKHGKENEDLHPTRKARGRQKPAQTFTMVRFTVQEMKNRRSTTSVRGCANLSISRVV